VSTTIDRLVVPLDGSDTTLVAFRVAEVLARRISVPVTALTVTTPAMGRYDDEVWLKERARSDEVAVDRVVELSDDVVGSILGAAEPSGAFLCLSSHGRSGPGAAILGSVSADVVDLSVKEVVLAGPRCRPPHRFDTVVVCVDATTPDEVVEAGARWATWLAASPLVLAVDDANRPRADEAVATLRALGLEPRVDVLHADDRAGAIVERADAEHAALVVAGARHRRGIDRLVLGSVSRALVHRSDVPVALVPPPHRP
jgi:nucleotide-binding universal stress UspA family protein